VNFHPFFRNEKDPVKKRAFYTNYYEVNLPVDIFTQVNTNINKVDLGFISEILKTLLLKFDSHNYVGYGEDI
jgi:hypothetical protein